MFAVTANQLEPEYLKRGGDWTGMFVVLALAAAAAAALPCSPCA